jgi:hypothetical protein
LSGGWPRRNSPKGELMLSVLLLSVAVAVIPFGQRLGRLARHRHLLRLASVVEPAAVSFREAQPNKAINLTFDCSLPSLSLRSVAVKCRLWQR